MHTKWHGHTAGFLACDDRIDWSTINIEGKPIYIELACRGSFFYLGSSAWASGTVDENGTAILTARVLSDKDSREETRQEETWYAPDGAETRLDVFIDGDGDGELKPSGLT